MHNPFKVGDIVRPRHERSWPAFESGARTARVERVDGSLCRVTADTRLWHYENLVAVINEPEPAQLQPSGHMPDGSGIQRHSAGGHYPYVLVYRDKKQYCDEFGRYDVGVIGPQNQTPLWFKSLNHAVRVIESMKGNEA